MSSPFSVYIDRLKNDDTEQIFESVDPSTLDLNDTDLVFTEKVIVAGQAYLAKNHLILVLKIKANALLPCSICNENTQTSIAIEDFSHTVEICEIKSAVYHFKEDVRSAILLKIPQFIECNEGRCPHRKDIDKYLTTNEPETYTPFSEIDSM